LSRKHNQLDLAKALQLELSETESALRSYVITGNSAKRDEYLKKTALITEESLPNLIGAVSGDDNATSSLKRLAELIRRRLQILNESHMAYETGSGGQNPIHRRGDVAMQQIAAAFQEFTADQHQILQARILDRKRESEVLMRAMLVSGILAVTIALLTLPVILRGLYRRREAERKIQASLAEKKIC
jgi:CHASE3 domain sensor protein